MSKVSVETDTLEDIGNAIREKNGKSTMYMPSQMGDAIRGLAGECVTNKDITVKLNQGTYKIGDVIPKGTAIQDIIEKMLTLVNYPSLVAPSATISASGDKLLECGATIVATMTITFNRGKIEPAYGTSGYRSGAATGYSLNGGITQVSNQFSQTISENGAKSFSAVVKYAAGEQPKDDTGENYKEPLPSGEVTTSNSINYEFVNALYSNAVNNAIVAKHSLISKSSKTYTFDFAPQTETSPEIFDVPADWNVSKIEMYSTITRDWENVAGDFDTTTVKHKNAANVDVNYVRYKDNRGVAAGRRQIRITFS